MSRLRWGSHATSLGFIVEMTDRTALVLWDDGTLRLTRSSAVRELEDDVEEDSFRTRKA